VWGKSNARDHKVELREYVHQKEPVNSDKSSGILGPRKKGLKNHCGG